MVDSAPSIELLPRFETDLAGSEGRSHLSDVIVGSLYMITSATCAAAYAVILMTIWRDEELRRISSYQLMFALGIFDVMQCLPHFITGLFTIFSHHYNVTLAKAISVFGTPCYVAYIVITLILAVNRFIQVVAPHLNLKLFSAPIVYVLPTGLWWQMALNFMWVANSGVYPLIYFIVNGTLRGRIAHRRTGGATTMAQKTIHKPSQFVSSFVKVNG
ncbi:unnamed protein product [Nippostrongylus brasiliensis]|uniref:G protein-coupled receptor n=1 Tax=Nippostrongylus brasiliensis TaxID=27835 RepID=A0A0N4XCK2_NIPBR|nr:unnamed protein product [Nippostrongylus brasiliensis]